MAWYYKEYGGAVLSSSIQKYMYVIIHEYFGGKRFRLKYSELEDVDSVEEVRHPLIRACLKEYAPNGKLEIASIADVPAGTGLGSSSSFTVALLHALSTYKGTMKSRLSLAGEACRIEIDVLGAPIGKQDQYAAACGGLNVIRFNSDESVSVEPVSISSQTTETLERRLRLYYLGQTRDANVILAEQNAETARSNKVSILGEMVAGVDALKRELERGNADVVGEVLHEAWMKKKSLVNGISSSNIDDVYSRAMSFGATGGKVLGAGGGGFFLLDHENHDFLEEKLKMSSLPFRIDKSGACIMPMF
ncbi:MULTISPECIES: GHMP family kinase ATP-binding protein [Thalassospira]|uniref:Kinase n=1 Tax=Thalassospira aquimaris TaxID=3037796 RepID=A0ABT6G6L4_9PROT|nr:MULTISPECIES: GHMP kinase [Thalassospira]MDG4717684.1 kinase [Thalassospira sp. FZY0004]